MTATQAGALRGTAATNGRKFNALLATASINDAIEYHALFKTVQAAKQAADADFQPHILQFYAVLARSLNHGGRNIEAPDLACLVAKKRQTSPKSAAQLKHRVVGANFEMLNRLKISPV